ncbi:unnamed protein product [Caenorhabditis brenneri]
MALEKCSAVIAWVCSSAEGASPRRDFIPTSIRMGNQVEMPFIGLGTGGIPSSEQKIEDAVRTALDLGYTHIDVSAGSHAVVGKVLKEYFETGKLTRKDVFITSKLPCSSHGTDSVENSLRTQLKHLQLSYVDMFLINTPCGFRIRAASNDFLATEAVYASITDTWKGMEKVYNLKLTRAIGVSNFNVEQIQRIYSSANVKPHNLQIELHLHWPQKEMVVLCQSLNVSLTAFAPLGSPGRSQPFNENKACPIEDPLVLQLAEKYKKTPAQILLRQLTQRDIVVIPKSTNAKHLQENLESLEFVISDEDMKAMGKIKPRARVYHYVHRKKHPEYPFCELDDEYVWV